jgi:hypothetical protein
MTSLDILDIVLITLTSLFAITSTMLLISTAKKEKQVKMLTLDKAILITEFAKVIEKQNNQSVEETEGFLKFVSESREWAFTYIEDIQQALMAYDVALSTDDAKIINDAYKKLISFLPDDDLV